MEASEITIIHGDKSVTMTGEEFAAATSPRIKEKEFRDVLRCELTKEELDDLAEAWPSSSWNSRNWRNRKRP